ncbi:MAG: DUF3322 domain-containing protein [Synergistaceae bacterium]|jgi:hypothetical protein|nr:DUF3322 domain-containing protein [Synergistaceae bacterium]
MPPESWTGHKDIVSCLERLWAGGKILSSMISGHEIFPLSIPVRGPSSVELGRLYGEARQWAKSLMEDAENSGRYRVTKRAVNHRMLGRNEIPDRIWVGSAEDALALLRKKRDAERFGEMIAFTGETCPPLLTFMESHPLDVLKLDDDWKKCVAVSLWIMNHPKPDIYLRQVDLPGVDTKFIERHKGLLSRLLKILLPSETVSDEFRGSKNFELRYGFKTDPVTIRFRLPLDCFGFPDCITDISLPSGEFAALGPVLGQTRSAIFVENKVNFLAIPRKNGLLAVWAKGYGFDSLSETLWLRKTKIYYWGDIDTHGFAILNQFRSVFPGAQSVLMDRFTFMNHRDMWVGETTPTAASLPNLTSEETALYDDLRRNILGTRLRLEQERLGFAFVTKTLDELFV